MTAPAAARPRRPVAPPPLSPEAWADFMAALERGPPPAMRAAMRRAREEVRAAEARSVAAGYPPLFDPADLDAIDEEAQE